MINMDWLGTVWNKINKPVHSLLVGGAFIYFAPFEYNWIGYIFLAFGLGGALEWLAKIIRKKYDDNKNYHHIKKAFSTLNQYEKEVLDEQIKKGEQTFYLNPFQTRSIPEHLWRGNLYQGLCDKEILEMTSADGKSAAVHITDSAWQLLQREQIAKNLEQ